MSHQRNTKTLSNFLGIDEDQDTFKNTQKNIKEGIKEQLITNPQLQNAVEELKRLQDREWAEGKGATKRGNKFTTIRVVKDRYGSHELILRKVADAVAETIVKQTEYENSSRYLKLEKVVDKPILGRKTRSKKS